MKRIFALCMVCMVLMGGVASAEISKGKDSFTGGLSVSSSAKCPYLDTFKFTKILSSETVTYEIKITKANLKQYLIADSPIEIKIDDFPIYELAQYKYNVTGPDSYGVEYNSIIKTKVSQSIIEKILLSNRVAIRFEDNDATRYPYTLPDNILAEWKQTINTEE